MGYLCIVSLAALARRAFSSAPLVTRVTRGPWSTYLFKDDSCKQFSTTSMESAVPLMPPAPKTPISPAQTLSILNSTTSRYLNEKSCAEPWGLALKIKNRSPHKCDNQYVKTLVAVWFAELIYLTISKTDPPIKRINVIPTITESDIVPNDVFLAFTSIFYVLYYFYKMLN
jgi:hypothetical protein